MNSMYRIHPSYIASTRADLHGHPNRSRTCPSSILRALHPPRGRRSEMDAIVAPLVPNGPTLLHVIKIQYKNATVWRKGDAVFCTRRAAPTRRWCLRRAHARPVSADRAAPPWYPPAAAPVATWPPSGQYHFIFRLASGRPPGQPPDDRPDWPGPGAASARMHGRAFGQLAPIVQKGKSVSSFVYARP